MPDLSSGGRDPAEIFNDALELPASQRETYVVGRCGNDSSLCNQVLTLLGLAERRPDLLAPPDREGDPGLPGRFQVLGVCGRGGMGVVYRATDATLGRVVAIKVIRYGCESGDSLRRFEAERRALAQLEHPGIARIYDSGETADHRPYFAMEYVPGVPITDYCDHHRLGLRARLDVFNQVCRAVHYAHQRGIIHRDLKPSNILVADEEGTPRPKVIDFGVARVVDRAWTDGTDLTAPGLLIGTAEYMSPEQTEMSGSATDATTDVYGLGAILYQLLSGVLPFDSDKLRAGGLAGLVCTIREVDPPRPSDRVAALGERSAEIANLRGLDSRRLIGRLRGDLDWVIMRALKKDRTKRYASALHLAEDLERYLHGDPVHAGPPGTRYRLGKAVRKHRGLSFTVAAILLMLSSGLVVALVLNARALKAQRNAEWLAYQVSIRTADADLRHGDAAAAERLLDGCPASLRQWEWSYLRSRTDLSSHTIQAHRNGVLGVAFDVAGASLVSVGMDSTLRSWDVSGVPAARAVRAFSCGITALATSSEGRRIACGGADGTVRLFDGPGLESAGAFRAEIAPIKDVALNPDGSLLVASYDSRDAYTWEISTRQLLSRIHFGGRTSRGVCFLDGRHLLISGDESVQVWDSRTGTHTRELAVGDSPLAIALSPDTRTLAVIGDSLSFLSLDTNVRRSYGTSEALFPAMCFDGAGHKLAAGTMDGTMEIVDVASGLVLARLCGHRAGVTALASSSSRGILASGSADGTVRIWEAAPDSLENWLPPGCWGQRIDLGPDGRRLFVALGDTVTAWDLSQRRVHRQFRGQGSDFPVFALSPDGRQIAMSDSLNRIFLQDVESGDSLFSLSGHRVAVHTLAFSPSGRLLASGSLAQELDAEQQLWLDRPGEPQALRVWDLSTRSVLHSLSVGGAGVRCLAFHPRETILAVGDRTLRLWNTQTGRLQQVPDLGNGICHQVFFSPDGSQLYAVVALDAPSDCGGRIKVWDTRTGRLTRTYVGALYPFSEALVDAEGVRLFTASAGGTIQVWEPRRGTELLSLKTGRVLSSIALSPDGRWIVSSSLYKGLEMWAAGHPTPRSY